MRLSEQSKGRTGQNNRSVAFSFIVVAIVCALFGLDLQAAAGATTSSSKKSARLIVQRTPNFGTHLVLQLSIDGRKMANISRNQHYGGIILAGRHVLTVLALPNTEARRPTVIRLTIRSGESYVYTAMWEQNRLVLRRSETYSPTPAAAPLLR